MKSYSKPYEYLEHTADIKIRAYGKDFQECLNNAILAVTGILVDSKKITAKETRSIVIEAKSKERLIYETLEEILFLFDVEGFVVKEVQSLSIIQNHEKNNVFMLKATLLGSLITQDAILLPIKAMTYHEMSLKETKEKTILEFVVDI